jgi:poly-gamma-glutamate capsule biosynthesis protein CapA/YwtB (metallophosphatase superfamily)
MRLPRRLSRTGCLGIGLLAFGSAGCETAGDRPAEPIDGGVRVAFVGQALIEHDPRAYSQTPLRDIRAVLMRADAAFTNLEVSVDNPDAPCVPTRKDQFFHGAPPKVAGFLAEIGIDLVSLSNNHSWDLGACGVSASIEAARAAGLAFAGTGSSITEAMAPAVFQARDLRIALVAVATTRLPPEAAATSERIGINTLDVDDQAAWDRNIAAIRAAAAASDIVIAYQHYQIREGGDFQQRWARAAIDAGAEIYVSHGQPELGRVEAYGGGLILYNLGNFIFHSRTKVGHYPAKAWQSVIAEVLVDSKGVKEVVFRPIVLNEVGTADLHLETRGLPALAAGAEAQAILLRMKELSGEQGSSFEVGDGQARMVLRR